MIFKLKKKNLKKQTTIKNLSKAKTSHKWIQK